jgi:drug/metabolite transporter (DMT)-like permease
MDWSVAALASAVFEGAGLGFEKKALSHEHAMEFCAAMSLFALVFSSFFWAFSGYSFSLEALALVFLSSLLSALSVLLIAKSLRHIAVDLVVPFLALSPLLAMLAGVFFFAESIPYMAMIGSFLVVAGLFSLRSHQHSSILVPLQSFRIKYAWYALLGGLFFAVAASVEMILVGQGFLSIPVLAVMPLHFFFFAVIFIVMMLLFHNGFHGIGKGISGNAFRLAMVALFIVLAKAAFLYSLSFQDSSIGLSSVISKLSLFFALMFTGELLYRERLAQKAFSSVLIIAGAVLVLL